MSKGLFNSNLSYEAMIFFCRDLSSLLSSGVPLESALFNISNQTPGEFSSAIKSIGKYVANGATLSDAMSNYNNFFSVVFVSTIRVAEASGNLDSQLSKLANQMEKEKRMEDGISEMIVYPKFLIYICLAILLINLLLMIPLVKSFVPGSVKFDSGFLKYFFQLSNFLRGNWKITLGAVVSSIVVFEVFMSTRTAKMMILDFCSVLPGFGGVIKNDAISRFLRGFALLIDSGISLIPAVKMAGEMSGSNDITLVSRKIAYVLEQGHTLTNGFYNTNYFNSSIISMVENAEKTGNYGSMFEQASRYYEEKAETRLKKVMSLMKPIITIFMAIFIFANIGMLIYPVIQIALKAVN